MDSENLKSEDLSSLDSTSGEVQQTNRESKSRDNNNNNKTNSTTNKPNNTNGAKGKVKYFTRKSSLIESDDQLIQPANNTSDNSNSNKKYQKTVMKSKNNQSSFANNPTHSYSDQYYTNIGKGKGAAGGPRVPYGAVYDPYGYGAYGAYGPPGIAPGMAPIPNPYLNYYPPPPAARVVAPPAIPYAYPPPAAYARYGYGYYPPKFRYDHLSSLYSFM
jgi:hypothetical protein